MKNDKNLQLFNFIKESPTAFHTISTISKMLDVAGFEALDEKKEYKLKNNEKYYVTRNGSSIIAFKYISKAEGFNIIASHSDSPTFRIKENPEIAVEGHYVKLNVEKYGGMIMSSWFDRPLSIAGRVMISGETGVESRLIDFDKDLCMIPNLAIHMNREANDGYKYNAQKDMLPIISLDTQFSLQKILAEKLVVECNDILDSDLFLYNREEGKIWGSENEFISASRLDDLQCAFGTLDGFLQVVSTKKAVSKMPVLCVFDNEEVGSGTKQGADSTFLYDTLVRINEAAGGNISSYLQKCANSFMLSADNAHALHPNYADKSCPTNKVFINEGVVIKYSANQKYTTDGAAAALVKALCKKYKVKYQTFVNRADMLGGSTLGNISATHVSIPTVDIGLPQFAMHSIYESAGAKDTEELIKLSKAIFEN